MKVSFDTIVEDFGGPTSFLRAAKDTHAAGPEWNPPLIIPQVPYEFSSWESEMRAWRENVALFDQTHHMPGLFVRGSDALKFLCGLACNNLEKSAPGRAHQILCVAPDGNMIGDGILFHLAEGELLFLGVPFAANWIAFNAEISELDVRLEADTRSPVYANGHASERVYCRYQIQGPKADALIEKLNGGPIGDVKFFHMTELIIAGHKVRGLRHGMAGAPGLEIWADYAHRDAIRQTILEQGREFGIAPVGALAYIAGGGEGGWIQYVVPSIFGEEMKPFREWLKPNCFFSTLQLKGSFASPRVQDYYRTPFDLGYGPFVKFDHEFIGREALEQVDPDRAQKKVSLVWNPDDVAALLTQMLTPGGKDVRFLHLPVMNDKLEFNYDQVTVGEHAVGTALYSTYSANERVLLTLATVDKDIAIGNEVTILWGNAASGSGDHAIRGDALVPIRATVAPVPYSPVARREYAVGWRSGKL